MQPPHPACFTRMYHSTSRQTCRSAWASARRGSRSRNLGRDDLRLRRSVLPAVASAGRRRPQGLERPAGRHLDRPPRSPRSARPTVGARRSHVLPHLHRGLALVPSRMDVRWRLYRSSRPRKALLNSNTLYGGLQIPRPASNLTHIATPGHPTYVILLPSAACGRVVPAFENL